LSLKGDFIGGQDMPEAHLIVQRYHFPLQASRPHTGKLKWARLAKYLVRNGDFLIFKDEVVGSTDWVETQATWLIYKTGSNWTAAGGDYVTSSPSGGSAIVPTPPGWMSWDVLAIVQDAYDGSNPAEFLVRFETEEDALGWNCDFYSNKYTGDTSLCPKLVIEYTPPLGLENKSANMGSKMVAAGLI
ncbi:unnamed protein product, partial [marine sediment metagenome]